MDQFMEEQEKDARAQVDALIAEHQDILQKMALVHDRKLNDLKLKLDASESKAQQQQVTWIDQYERLRNDYDVLSLAYQGIKKERDQLQQKLKDLMDTTSRENNSNVGMSSLKSDTDNNTWTTMAQQHKNELELLHDQYQKLLDIKDHELEDYGSRVQALTLEQQKALASCRMELGDRINSLETQVDGYEATIRNNNERLTELQTQFHDSEQQNQKSIQTIHALIEDKTVLEKKLDSWMRYACGRQDEACNSPVE